MAGNLYHHLSFMPATESWEMPRGLELLARRLVASGKLRINADAERNFVRYGEMTFSAREITDLALLEATRVRIARLVAPAAGAQGIEDIWDFLKAELKKARGITPDKEMKVTRVLAQSAAPEVIELLMKSGAEIYVSYAHNVADLMPVHEWQNLGANSGLQATDSAGAAVYISAGGDPFFEGNQKTYTTDGFPALARMVVIAGQEFGHFADLRRNVQGAVIGRYSTDIDASQLRADPIMHAACIRDRARVNELISLYNKTGLLFLRRAEKGLEFYQKHRRYSPPWLFYQAWRLIAFILLKIKCKQQNLVGGFHTLPRMRSGEAIEAYLADMQYNLAPDADVYRHPDPLVEEAIAVIEALARVPQQIHKWGFFAVQAAWPGLTECYFSTVLPACRAQLGQKHETKNTLSILRILIICFKRAVRTKPGYYP